jgi:Ser/Thr protein kinase RdoA (MazF antagonist)
MARENNNSPALTLPSHFRDLVATHLGCAVLHAAALAGGRQNRLFLLELASGDPCVLKIYQRDRRRRLEREFAVPTAPSSASSSLRVPRPLFKDLDASCAAYTRVPGCPRPPAALSVADAALVGALAAALHQVTPAVCSGVELAPEGVLSAAAHVDLIRARAAAAPPALGAGLADLVRDLPASDSAPDPSAWRLGSGDFGVNNLLFTESAVGVVDFEAGGWDDPAHMVTMFPHHAGSNGLAAECAVASARA